METSAAPASRPPGSTSDGPILFYDGECGLCARWVQFCLARDRRGQLRYAPLQGTTYARLPIANKPRDMSTIVVLDQGRSLVRSDAVLRLLRIIGGPWRIAAALGALVPRPVRDWLYDFVAIRRMRWFGMADSCRLPRAGEAARMLP